MIASQLVVNKMYKSWQWIRNTCSSRFEATCSRLIDCNWKRILPSRMCRYQNWQRENRADAWLMVVSQPVVSKIYESWQWIKKDCSSCFEDASSRMTFLLVSKTLVVGWLIAIEKDYYQVECVGITIDKERTHTALMYGSW